MPFTRSQDWGVSGLGHVQTAVSSCSILPSLWKGKEKQDNVLHAFSSSGSPPSQEGFGGQWQLNSSVIGRNQFCRFMYKTAEGKCPLPSPD